MSKDYDSKVSTDHEQRSADRNDDKNPPKPPIVKPQQK